MAKKQTNGDAERNRDRHKARKMIGLPQVLVEQLDVLCQRNVTDRTTEVVRAVREMLIREGLWPPPEGQQLEE